MLPNLGNLGALSWRADRNCPSRDEFGSRVGAAPGREGMPMPIVIERENPDELQSPLRVLSGGVVRGDGLNAAQAYVLVGELLEEIVAATPAGSSP